MKDNKSFKGDPEKNKKYIYDKLIEDGFSHAAAVGVVGNILLETGNFKYIEEIAPNMYGQKGLGILQWSGSRAKDFKAWLETNNKEVADIKDNVEYLLLEMKKRSRHHWSNGVGYEDMKKIDSVEKATHIFMQSYLRPNAKTSHIARRLAYAEKYDKVFKGEEVEDSSFIKDIDKEIEQDLQRNRHITEAKEDAEVIVSKIGMANSSISKTDVDRLKNQAKFYMLNGAIINEDNDPVKGIVSRAYRNTDYGLLNKQIINDNVEEDVEEVEEEKVEEDTDDAPPLNELALGGFTQPNGRLTDFMREEDVLAQNKTSINP